MNCPLCNVPCGDRVDTLAHLAYPVKSGGHARSLADARALLPELTGKERCIQKFHGAPFVPEDGDIPYPNSDAEFEALCSGDWLLLKLSNQQRQWDHLMRVATKIGDRVAVLVTFHRVNDELVYEWQSGYVTEIYSTQTVVALDDPIAVAGGEGPFMRTHLRRASRFVRAIG